jgi:hypothetical protein
MDESTLSEKLRTLNLLDKDEPIGEEWRELEEFPGYKISNYGRLRMLTGKISIASSSRDEYVTVFIKRKDGNFKNRKIHILVARAFLPNPENKPTVDHIDRDRSNNHVNNLRWATKSEQRQNQTSPDNRNISERYIIQRDLEGKVVKIWDNMNDLLQNFPILYETSITRLNINWSIRGGLAKGYRFEYCFDNLDGEEWVDLDLDGKIYRVSSCGRVRGHSHAKNDGFLGPSYGTLTKTQYYIHARQLVHRLVAYAFIDNDDPVHKTFVNHIDNNPQNNQAGNLEWVTPKGNSLHARDFVSAAKRGNNCRTVVQIDLDGNEIARFPSIKAAAAALGVSTTGIGGVCRGENKTCRGFKWEYGDT